MRIHINGQSYLLQPPIHLQQALLQCGYTQQNIAVAINQQFIPRSLYQETWLHEGDSIVVAEAMEGG